jgi:uncharacterized repeat protein (TIGR02543 family)
MSDLTRSGKDGISKPEAFTMIKKTSVILLTVLVILGLGFLGCDNGNSVTTYTVTFDSDGGTPATSKAEVDEGGTAALPAAPAKGGYTFGGWYTVKNGGGTEFTASTVITADITVYAKWINAVPALPETLAIGDAALTGTLTGTIEELQYGGGLGFGKYYVLTGDITEGSRIRVTFTLKTGGEHFQQVCVQSSIYSEYEYIGDNDKWYSGTVPYDYTAIIPKTAGAGEDQGLRFDFKRGKDTIAVGDSVTITIENFLIEDIGPEQAASAGESVTFDDVEIGTEYGVYKIYDSNDVLHLPKVVEYAGDVETDAGKVLQVYPNDNINGYAGILVTLPVTLPEGKTIADYSTIEFRTILENYGNEEGQNSAYHYKGIKVYIDSTAVAFSSTLQTEWNSGDDHLTTISIPEGTTSENTFNLNIGIDADKTDQPYYIVSVVFKND